MPLRSTSIPRGENPSTSAFGSDDGRQLVDFRQRGLRRIRTGHEPHDRARESERRSPDRSVGRRRRRVERRVDALVLRRIHRLIRLDVGVAPAVAVGVDDQRRPSLRRHFVAGLVELLRVQPSDHLAAAARPQRPVRVFGEHQMVRGETRADVRQLFRLRVVHLQMAARVVHREQPSPTDALDPALQKSGFSGGRTAEVSHSRFFSSSIGLCTLFLLVQMTSSPQYGDGVRHLRVGRRRVRIAHRQRNAAGRVLHRIEHRHVVGAQLERAVNRPVRIEPRVAAIGRHRIVQVRFRIGPVPLRDHDVALDAARARRRRRHFACRNAIGPVGEHLERAPPAERC